MSMRNPLERRVIAALLMVLLTACHSWRPTTVSPQGWTPEERPSSVRATLTNGETITVENPIVRNDGPTPNRWTVKCLCFLSSPKSLWSQKLPLRRRRRGVAACPAR